MKLLTLAAGLLMGSSAMAECVDLSGMYGCPMPQLEGVDTTEGGETYLLKVEQTVTNGATTYSFIYPAEMSGGVESKYVIIADGQTRTEEARDEYSTVVSSTTAQCDFSTLSMSQTQQYELASGERSEVRVLGYASRGPVGALSIRSTIDTNYNGEIGREESQETCESVN